MKVLKEKRTEEYFIVRLENYRWYSLEYQNNDGTWDAQEVAKGNPDKPLADGECVLTPTDDGFNVKY